MDEAQVTVNKVGFDLTGQVQQRGAGGECFHQRPGGVAGARAGAGDAHAQHAADAGGGVGHVAGTGLAPRRHKVDTAAPVQGIEHRHVVDRDHAKGDLHPALLQKTGDQFAHGDHGGRVGGIRRSHAVRGSANAGCLPRLGRWLRRWVS